LYSLSLPSRFGSLQKVTQVELPLYYDSFHSSSIISSPAPFESTATNRHCPPQGLECPTEIATVSTYTNNQMVCPPAEIPILQPRAFRAPGVGSNFYLLDTVKELEEIAELQAQKSRHPQESSITASISSVTSLLSDMTVNSTSISNRTSISASTSGELENIFSPSLSEHTLDFTLNLHNHQNPSTDDHELDRALFQASATYDEIVPRSHWDISGAAPIGVVPSMLSPYDLTPKSGNSSADIAADQLISWFYSISMPCASLPLVAVNPRCFERGDVASKVNIPHAFRPAVVEATSGSSYRRAEFY
ncbi:hypothetical protein DL93DRAFT_2078025, partial [Clavulina sp. PMI_390]